MKTKSSIVASLVSIALSSCGTKSYDLIAVDIHADKAEATTGDQVRFSYTFKNGGMNAIPPRSYTTRVYIDGILYRQRERAPIIRPRESITVDETHVIDGLYVPSKTGKQIVKLVLDEDGDLNETNENNNTFEFELNVIDSRWGAIDSLKAPG